MLQRHKLPLYYVILVILRDAFSYLVFQLWRGGVHTFEEKYLFPNIPDPFPERRGVLTKVSDNFLLDF